MLEAIFAAVCSANRVYLHKFLSLNPPERHAEVISSFEIHMSSLARFCHDNYHGAGTLTTDFIRELHRRHYPDGYREVQKRDDGSEVVTMVPGEYKQLRNLGLRKDCPTFCEPALVAEAMEALVRSVNTSLLTEQESSRRRELIILFGLDMVRIHPFADANGRIAYLLVDVLLIHEGLPPLSLCLVKEQDSVAFFRVLEHAWMQRDVSALDALLEKGETSRDMASNAPVSRVPLDRLLAEAAEAAEAGDLPVGAVFSVDGIVVASGRNSSLSRYSRRFHAERNLIGQLSAMTLPAGRRVFWVTLEPCKRCAQAIRNFGADEVVYLCDDPFGGGKEFLVEAGISVTKADVDIEEYLRCVMASFGQQPELCAGRLYRHFLSLWAQHHPLDTLEQTRAVFLQNLSPSLVCELSGQTPDRYAEMRQAFFARIDHLARLSAEYGVTGTLSVAFVRELHRTVFNPDFRHRAVGRDGAVSEILSGEWRQHHPALPHTVFPAAESVEAELTVLLDGCSTRLPGTREGTLAFYREFLRIHPFAGGNGLIASILADLLCIGQGVAPLALMGPRHAQDRAFDFILHGDTPLDECLKLVDSYNLGQIEVGAYDILEIRPSAFTTYVERTGGKQVVVEHVLDRLRTRTPLQSPFVVTDIGAGTGAIAQDVVEWLVANDCPFEYHFVEPNVDYVQNFKSSFPLAGRVTFHVMPMEDYLIPASDLILFSQSLQYLKDTRETLQDAVSGLKPGGEGLIVVSHPVSDEWLMTQRLTHGRSAYEYLKELLDLERIGYEEFAVESPVRISLADRGTVQGDDLLAFYFHKSPASLPAATIDAFWSGLETFARDGAVRKNEACLWFRRAGGAS